jgi:hypothetical protein
MVARKGVGSFEVSRPEVVGCVPFSPPCRDVHRLEQLLLVDPVHDVSEQGWPHAEAD